MRGDGGDGLDLDSCVPITSNDVHTRFLTHGGLAVGRLYSGLRVCSSFLDVCSDTEACVQFIDPLCRLRTPEVANSI